VKAIQYIDEMFRYSALDIIASDFIVSWILMPRLYLTVLATRNETLLLRKRICNVYKTNFWLAVWNKLSILFTNNYCASVTTRKYFYTSFHFGSWLSNLYV